LLIPFLELKQIEKIEKKDKIEMGKSTFTSMDIIQKECPKGVSQDASNDESKILNPNGVFKRDLRNHWRSRYGAGE
jgi:hypothetical protein